MQKKVKNVTRFWNEDEEWQRILKSEDFFNYEDFDSLQKFEGTHPQVAEERISRQSWKIDFNISQKRFSIKDRFLYWFEKKTGKRPFEFRYYRLI